MKIFIVIFVCSLYAATAQQFRETLIPTRVSNSEKKYLLADLYISDSSVSRPTILIQTPYNKALYRLSLGKVVSESGASVPYDTAKYNYVITDWRGFYANKKADSALYNRGLDGYDIVEWIARQTWCNGKVGTWGGSALGLIQFQTAAQQPPHLICAAPFIKDFKTKYNDYYYGGNFRKEQVQSLVKLGFITEKLVLSHPILDAYWKLADNLTDISKKIAVPMFMCSGWFDHYPDDVLRAFDDIRNNSASGVRSKHKLLFGPWMHTSIGVSEQGILNFPNAAGIPVEDGMRFFDYYLRDEQNGWESVAPVRYYQMGDNIWREAESLNNATKENATLYFHEGGRLSFEPPPITFRPIPPDTLRANPRQPVPTIGGSRFNPFDRTLALGPQDISELLSRKDVLSYSTEPLSSPVSLVGSSEVKIYFDCNRLDADLSVRLCDIYPDERWVILTQGIQRLRLRYSLEKEQLITPDVPDSTTIRLTDLAITFPVGHRIGLIITGSNYPMFDVNPNSGGDLYAPSDTLTAETHISLTREAPSAWNFKTTGISSGIKHGEAKVPFSELFPNPASDVVALQLYNAVGTTQVYVLDILGNIMFSAKTTDNHIIIPTSKMQTGIYSVKIISGQDIRAVSLCVAR